jgi:O-acetyl-ADP-ribose deacetylase (regulator of RNase III)
MPRPVRLPDRIRQDDARLRARGQARHHAVGPLWAGGDRDEDALLASCYRASMGLAAGQGLRSIAFPAISTGIYGFPPDRAARIAVATVIAEITAAPGGFERVVFCCFSNEAANHHRVAFGALGLA